MTKKPNILFFFPDQWHPDWLGCNPELDLKTPNIDWLMENGVRFTNAYTPSPLCAPARACLAAGQDYKNCGVFNNQQDYDLSIPTYYQVLRGGGYRVAGVGKFDLHKDLSQKDWYLDGSRLLDEWGFTEGIDNEGKFDAIGSYKDNNGPVGPYMNYLVQEKLIETHLEEYAKGKGHWTTELPEEAYCDNWLSNNGINFLRNFPEDAPWHLVINFTGPHNPMDVTKRMRADWKDKSLPMPEGDDSEVTLERRRNYAAMIENIDRKMGIFIDEVRKRGELDNTLIVFSSDHGEMLGDHGRWGKATWYEGSTCVPLVISGPGIAKGIETDALVVLQDITATFLDYANLPKLPEMEGQSLRGILENDVYHHRDFVISGLQNPRGPRWDMVYDGRYKYIKKEDEEILYDLKEDPDEDKNIIDSNLDIAAKLRVLI